ncbi:AbrB/MazE/SpoVT family DNA-binding domain-containing protein [Salinibacter pepae]|uniref:AbrB/MazE/SpoVT family DNA-binding domain-containing protein n=1 Tax=Salinibacter pepae TaxID=3040382 RepID=UPI003C6E9696
MGRRADPWDKGREAHEESPGFSRGRSQGRIVIPKEVRDHLGIDSGTALKISVEPEEGDGGAITLRPKEQRPPLRRKGELLVHSGEPTVLSRAR